MPILEDSAGNIYVIEDDTSSNVRPGSLPSLNGSISQYQVELPYGYEIVPGDGEDQLVGVSVMSLDPVSSSDASGLTAVMLELLGDYSPVRIEWEYQNSNGYSSYLREVQPDYPWLVSAGIFALVLYCLIRMGVAMLCKK